MKIRFAHDLEERVFITPKLILSVAAAVLTAIVMLSGIAVSCMYVISALIV